MRYVTDDRNFLEYEEQFGGRRIKYVTFREYVQGVVSAGPSRHEEFEILVNFFTLPILEQVLEGKTIIESKDFLKGINNECQDK